MNNSDLINQLLTENKKLKKQLKEFKKLEKQHKRTEQELKSSQERLKVIFDSAPDAIILLDFNGIFLDFNKVVEEALEYKKEDLIGKSIFELNIISPGEIDKILKGFENGMKGMKFGPLEVTLKNKNNETVYSEISAYPVTIDDKMVVLAIARNISERKKSEEIIHRNEQELALHFNQTPLGVIEWDLNFNVTKWNPAAENIFGYSKEEALGKHVSFILPAKYTKEKIDSWLNSFAKSKNGKTNINENVKKSGDIILCEWFNVGLINKNNKVFAIASWVQDITERVKSNKIQKVIYNISNAVNTTDNLHKLIAFIRDELGNIIDTTNFYIALYNEKNDTFTLPFFVDEVDQFNEMPAGKTLTKYVVKTKKPVLATLAQMKELEQKGEIEIVGSDSKVWLGVPLITEGKISGVLAVQSYDDENAFSDTDVQMLEFVSDQISLSIHRKKTEDELVAALKKAEESDRLKTTFLQNISHEIRTPMNGILGFTALLKEPDIDKSEQKEYLDIIEKSGERMLNTINDLMDISKIESGQINVIKTEININEQINYLYNFFLPEAENKGIKLTVTKTLSDKEATIITDREKLYAILTNLIKNALKYTHTGSIGFGYKHKAGAIEFFVKDTGIGIAKDKIKSIFDRFVRVHQDLTSNYEGTGLGLSITEAYVNLLGGKIWVESELGKGSQFYLEIPRGTTLSESELIGQNEGCNSPQKKNKNLKILIADDDKTIRTYLSIVVRNFSREILLARNGKEAVDIFRDNPDTDLILMDIKMPGVDGYEATKIIREFNNKVIIIAQTAFAFESEREHVINAGCNDYITKPINKSELINIIESYF